MKFSPVILVMACAVLSVGTAAAADQPEPSRVFTPIRSLTPEDVERGVLHVVPPSTNLPATGGSTGFGSGSGMGRGGGMGSASSLGGGFGAPSSGSGSQNFGAGFNQQTPGSGPFATNPALNPALGAGGAGGVGRAL